MRSQGFDLVAEQAAMREGILAAKSKPKTAGRPTVPAEVPKLHCRPDLVVYGLRFHDPSHFLFGKAPRVIEIVDVPPSGGGQCRLVRSVCPRRSSVTGQSFPQVSIVQASQTTRLHGCDYGQDSHVGATALIPPSSFGGPIFPSKGYWALPPMSDSLQRFVVKVYPGWQRFVENPTIFSWGKRFWERAVVRVPSETARYRWPSAPLRLNELQRGLRFVLAFRRLQRSLHSCPHPLPHFSHFAEPESVSISSPEAELAGRNRTS